MNFSRESCWCRYSLRRRLEVAKRVATKIITCSRSRIEPVNASRRLYALTLNESHYVRHYRRTYYLPHYRNLKFRSCASHLLRFAAEIMRAANRSLACCCGAAADSAIDSRSFARRVSRIPTSSTRARLEPPRCLLGILAPSHCAMP